jgi:LmbE family N-acetylglucosaminyl deacetylase
VALLSAVLVSSPAGAAAPALAATPTTLEVDRGERLVVVAPHPDDETIGAGGLIRRVLDRGGSARVILVTAGDGYIEAVRHALGEPQPRPAEYLAYGERRLAESRAALRVLGPGARLQVLGFPDGGLERLLRAHWRRTEPERSVTTAVSRPPYPDAIDPNVAYDGADLVHELERLLEEAQPTLIALPDPLDRHPDHRATAIFTLLALEAWARQWNRPPAREPRVLGYLVHWPGWPPGWDGTGSLGPHDPLLLPATLPARGLPRAALVLSDSEIVGKRIALGRYATQHSIMASFLNAFARATEPYTVLATGTLDRVGKLVERPPVPRPRRPTPQ